jgi:hypothetical protein
MSEMVERVARAIDKAMQEQHDPTPGYLARAAIEAMREPTIDMLRVADVPVGGDYLSPKECWRGMIDAALKCTSLGADIAEHQARAAVAAGAESVVIDTYNNTTVREACKAK